MYIGGGTLRRRDAFALFVERAAARSNLEGGEWIFCLLREGVKELLLTFSLSLNRAGAFCQEKCGIFVELGIVREKFIEEKIF